MYSSDLQRAHDTAQRLLSKSKVGKENENITLSESIREIAYGVREGLSRRLTPAEAKVEFARRNNMAVEDVVDHAESTENVKKRQREFIQELLREYQRENINNESLPAHGVNPGADILHPTNVPILCVSHGGYIKLFLKTYCAFPIEKSLGNCSISIVTIEWTDENDPLTFTCTTSADKVDIIPHVEIK